MTIPNENNLNIRELLKQRILVLDGAMGTMIQQYTLEEEDYRSERFKDWHCDVKGNNDLLSLSQPQIIKDIHEEYLKAGSDIIETNTFNATRIAMADYDMEDLSAEINFESARLAKEIADEYSTPDKPRFVAGLARQTEPVVFHLTLTIPAFETSALMSWPMPITSQPML